jgi:outer membrane protein assembly factor BamB
VVGIVLLLVVGYVSTRGRRPQLGAVAWSHGGGAGGLARIAVGEEALVAAWEYGSITAHSTATGAPLWRMPFDRARQFDAPPAVGGGRIVVGSSDGFVRCVDLKTGEAVWGRQTATVVRSTPLILKDRVYIGGDDGRLYCLALKDGEVVWTYPAPDQADRGAVLGGAAFAGGLLVYGSCEREAVGVDPLTGKLRWRVPFDGPIVAPVTGAGGLAYAVAENGDVRCLAAVNGEELWTKRLPCLTRQPVTLADHRAFILASDGSVHCLAAQTGLDLWTRKLHGRPTTSAVVGNGRLYVGTSEQLVEALSLETGKPVWRWRPGSKPLGDLQLDGRHLYCTTAAGRVFAVRLGLG